MPDVHITRSQADALIQPEIAREIIKDIPEQSAALKLMRRLPNMSTKTRKMPVLSQTPMAGFISGDIGLKPTSTAAWENKYIIAEEIAVIPIHERMDDSRVRHLR